MAATRSRPRDALRGAVVTDSQTFCPPDIDERKPSPLSTSHQAKCSNAHVRSKIERSADRLHDCRHWTDYSEIVPVARAAAERAIVFSLLSPVSAETGARRRLCSAKIYLVSWRLSAHTAANGCRSKVIAGRFYDGCV